MSQAISHKDRAHAVLSASSSSRWLNCTPSVRLEEQFEDTTSEYAKEGTLSHEIAELKLRKYYTEPMTKAVYSRRLNKFKKHELYQPEMDKHTDTYLDYLKELTISLKSQPFVAVEKQVDYSAWAPEGFGTVDCLIISGDTLYVTDFKYGKGVQVSAEGNTQMMLYALGAYAAYSFLYSIQRVRMTIVQPRLNNISESELLIEDLLEWAESIKPIAQQAYNGEGTYNPGEHCKFCRAKAVCRARADQFTALEDFGQKQPPLLSDAEVGQVLERGQHIAAWISALKEYALSASLNGNEVQGFKAVEGKGSRDYVDLDRAFEYLQSNGIEEALLYDRVPITVPKLEKALGKKQYVELLEEPQMVVKYPGKPTLVPVSDKRPAVTNVATPEEDFG